ncbi:hypothetical protein HK104_006258, partial [Borealophlyctis nickersoniae]
MTVMSAFEGIATYAPSFTRSGIMGTSIVVLLILLFSQRFGISNTLRFYGPIMLLWFFTIATIGVYNIVSMPSVIQALSPHWMARLVRSHPAKVHEMLGEVVLAVTGAEALYTDLGHFKRLPIRLSFLALVYPSLMLSYLGQAAYLLQHPEAAHQPFFFAVPQAIKWPVLALATTAAIIASQATISGCFTLIDQGISLNCFPNVQSIHTVTSKGTGAVYIPAFSYMLMGGSVVLVLLFRDTDHLADTFGIAVTGSMTLTCIFFLLVMRYSWNLPVWKVSAFAFTFLTLDLLFLSSTLRKVSTNGWVTILISFVMFCVMYVWETTTSEVSTYLHERLLDMQELRQNVKMIHRTQGTMVFVSNGDEDVPNVLTICARRLNTLPTNVVCMSAISSSTPFIADEERTVFRTIDAVAGIYRLVISYGYAERSIDTIGAIDRARKRGLRMPPGERVTFIVGRELIASGPESHFWQRIRRKCFDAIARNTQGRVEYFNLPPNDTLE